MRPTPAQASPAPSPASAPPAGAPRAASVIAVRMRPVGTADTAMAVHPREAVRKAVHDTLALWPENARLVVETADGLAIVALQDPARALEAAARLGASGRLWVGLHHGPVQVLPSAAGPRLTGDGIASAHAVAGLDATVPVAVTREFRHALRQADPSQADALRPAGELIDAQLRAHTVFAPDLQAAAARRKRRTVLLCAGLAGVLAAGVAGRIALERYEAARRPAVLVFDIRPTGEVWIDGELKGTAPPLARVTVAPGAHSIEVRSTRARPLKLDVQLQPGEEMEVRHVFNMPPVAPRRKEAPGLLERLRSWNSKP